MQKIERCTCILGCLQQNRQCPIECDMALVKKQNTRGKDCECYDTRMHMYIIPVKNLSHEVFVALFEEE